MLVDAGDNGRMLGVNGPQGVAIVGEVEFDRWQGKAFAKHIYAGGGWWHWPIREGVFHKKLFS
jgi:hypothetical protein